MERLHNGFTLSLCEGTFPLSTDSIALSGFVRLPRQAKVLDLGSGCGTLGMLLCASDPSCAVTGVEIDEKAHLTALENVELANQICRDPLDAEQVLRHVGLGERLNNFPAQLSGGEQQMLAIGRALMNAPAVVLADEPPGNLDSKNSQDIVELLKLSNERYGQTLIMITHDENIALQADRIIAIEDGKITRDEVISR